MIKVYIQTIITLALFLGMSSSFFIFFFTKVLNHFRHCVLNSLERFIWSTYDKYHCCRLLEVGKKLILTLVAPKPQEECRCKLRRSKYKRFCLISITEHGTNFQPRIT